MSILQAVLKKSPEVTDKKTDKQVCGVLDGSKGVNKEFKSSQYPE